MKTTCVLIVAGLIAGCGIAAACGPDTQTPLPRSLAEGSLWDGNGGDAALVSNQTETDAVDNAAGDDVTAPLTISDENDSIAKHHDSGDIAYAGNSATTPDDTYLAGALVESRRHDLRTWRNEHGHHYGWKHKKDKESDTDADNGGDDDSGVTPGAGDTTDGDTDIGDDEPFPTGDGTPPIGVIPEPSTIILLGLGALGLAGIARKSLVKRDA